MGQPRKLPYSKGMSPARVVVVCAIVAMAMDARADDRRAVAVIALTKDPAAGGLHNALYDALQTHWALRALGDPDKDSALAGPLIDEDANKLADLQRIKTSVDDLQGRIRYDEARREADRGLELVAKVTPSKAGAVAAELAFQHGLAELSLRKTNDAYKWFALVHRLDPMRRPDAERYDPDIANAYEKAQATKPARYKLEVRGSGRAWIDGIDAGPAPGTYEVDDGWHLVQLAGPELMTDGKTVRVAHDDAIAIEAKPANELLRLQRARLALHDAPDDSVARAGPMKQLAELLGVHDAVLIWQKDDALWVQTWRDRAPGFSALREHVNEPPIELLAPLSPPKPPEPEPPISIVKTLPPVGPVEHEPAWYRRRWVQASVAGGVVAAVIGAILWARHTTHTSINNKTGWEGMSP
jgi:hypothetical protein